VETGALLIDLGFAAAIVYLPLQIYTIARWKGAWRLSSLLPLVVMVPAYAVAYASLVQRSNLWPVWMILISPVAVVYQLALTALHLAHDWKARK
jgi:hypothetical protein